MAGLKTVAAREVLAVEEREIACTHDRSEFRFRIGAHAYWGYHAAPSAE